MSKAKLTIHLSGEDVELRHFADELWTAFKPGGSWTGTAKVDIDKLVLTEDTGLFKMHGVPEYVAEGSEAAGALELDISEGNVFAVSADPIAGAIIVGKGEPPI